MAKSDKAHLSTCPVCGYTDSSADPETLELDIQDHMRTVHNLDPSMAMGSDTVKPVNGDEGVNTYNEPPAAAPVGTLGTSASGAMAAPNLGHTDHHGAPGDPETDARDPYDASR